MASSIRAVFLDFDGTLVDSERFHHKAWMTAVENYNAHADWDDYLRRFVGKTDKWAGETLLSEAGHEATPERVSEVASKKHAHFREHAVSTMMIEGDLQQFLREDLEHLKLAIVSSSPTRDVSPIVERSGLADRFEFMVLGEMVSNHKPHPEPYEQAFDQMSALVPGLNRPECLVFEDSNSGVASGEAAGLEVIRVSDPDSLLSLMRGRL